MNKIKWYLPLLIAFSYIGCNKDELNKDKPNKDKSVVEFSSPAEKKFQTDLDRYIIAKFTRPYNEYDISLLRRPYQPQYVPLCGSAFFGKSATNG